MNKKIVGFVLAMVLTVGLGCSNLFAYVDTGDAGNLLGGDGSSSQLSVTVKYSDPEIEQFAESTKGNLVTFFGYVAGTMTYAATKNSLSFYDANGLRASYSVNKDATTGKYDYTLTALNLSGSDYAMLKDKYNGDLKKFLVEGLGVSEKALKTIATDKNGNIEYEDSDKTKAKLVDAAWLTKASEYLANGINFSVSINLGGSEPTVTLSEDGKAQSVYGSFKGDAYVTTNYIYENGFLKETKNAVLKSTTTSDGQQGYTLEYNVTVMDKFGRQDYTYATDKDGNKIKFKKQKKEIGDDGKWTGGYVDTEDDSNDSTLIKYKYSNNGSLASSEDFKTGNVTHFVAGQAAFITNDAGKVQTQYKYHNGILQSVQNFNDSTAVNITVYDDFGRELGTCIGTNQDTDAPVTYEQAKNAIYEVLNHPEKLDNTTYANNCLVQNIRLYKDYADKYKSFIDSQENLKGFYDTANKQYGYINAIGTSNIATGDKLGNDENAIVESTDTQTAGSTTSTSTKTVTKSLAGKYKVKVGNKKYNVELEKGSNGRIELSGSDAKELLMAAGVKEKDVKNYLKKSNKKGKYYINLGKGDKGNKIGKKIFKALGISVNSKTKFNEKKEGIKGYCLGSSYKATVKTTTKKTTTKTTTTKTKATAAITTTLSLQGAQFKSMTSYAGNEVSTSTDTDTKDSVVKRTTTVKSADKVDPAVVGKVDRIVNIKGKKYAVLKNAKVDMVDGKGFQSADGEEMYVCIDGLSKEQQKSLKKGATFAAAGYIDKSADGHYAINNIYASKIGSDTVHNMVQSFSATLQGNAEYQTNLASNMINIAKGKAAGSIKDNYNYKELWKFYMGANF